MRSVLFVCTANICRSPMAMGLFQAMVEQSEGEWRIESAGTWAPEGEPAAAKSKALLSDRGIDISAHRSRSVTVEILRPFNLILTMEQGHKEALQVEFPEIAKRVYMLSEMVDSKRNVRDPMGSSLADFEDTLQHIEQILTDGFEKIQQLASDEPTS